MGLLDLLQGQGGGGLLDFLKSLQPQGLALSPDMQPANFNPAQGYQPQAMQANAQMAPQQSAPIPQQPPPVIQAQPAQAPQQQPAQAQQQQPDNSGFMTGYQNFRHGGGLIGSIVAGMTGQRNDPYGEAQQQQQQTQNLTAKALLAKGVDPLDVQAAMKQPDLLKALFAKTYGPQTVQSLGGGYIADKNGKISRAYVPDEKTPAGFAEDDKGNLHFRPGGPADPAYQRLLAAQKNDPNAVHVLGKDGELYKVDEQGNPTVVHKNVSASDATLDDKTSQAMADQYLAGDRTVLQNLGRGAQGAANIVKLRQTIQQRAEDAGVDPKGIVNNFNEQAGALAGQRAIGTRAANISLAANEANNMIPIALDASEKLPRSQYMPWNQMIQAVQKGSSSPELASFVAATNSLVNSYVRAVSPSGVPTDAMRQHAYDMLNAAQGPEAYKSVVNTMKMEMNAALQAPSQVRQELKKGNDPTKSEQSAPPNISKAEAEAELRRRGLIK